MKKIIAKEVNPAHVDFSYYFEDDSLKSISGENCAVYIPGDRWHDGFNAEEYKQIIKQAESIIDGFEEVKSGYSGYYDSYRAVMQDYGVHYTSRKCHLLKEWVEHADPYDASDIAEFLTITTGEEWNVRAFRGYCQGDYCEVVYCTAHYSEEHITEIGKFWLGCGTEFCIDGCYGYYVPDTIRWREGDELRQYLADAYGCKPDELEIYLYDGERAVTDYKIMK